MASEYEGMQYLKETKARARHSCHHCGGDIGPGDTYFREQIDDRFLHSLHGKKYCSECYSRLGVALLNMKRRAPQLTRRGPQDPSGDLFAR